MQSLQKVLLLFQIIFPKKYQCWYTKTQGFYAYFKFVDTDLKKCPLKNIAE
jgi:hypothetical protein